MMIASIHTRLENLSSLACKTVLIIIPVLFAVAHIAADGKAWNFATGETFSPMFNVVSSYAWRSPALRTVNKQRAALAAGEAGQELREKIVNFTKDE